MNLYFSFAGALAPATQKSVEAHLRQHLAASDTQTLGLPVPGDHVWAAGHSFRVVSRTWVIDPETGNTLEYRLAAD